MPRAHSVEMPRACPVESTYWSVDRVSGQRDNPRDRPVASSIFTLWTFKRDQLTPVINRDHEVFEKHVTNVHAPRLLVASRAFAEKYDCWSSNKNAADTHILHVPFPVLRNVVVTNRRARART